jgi:hypothetical protein
MGRKIESDDKRFGREPSSDEVYNEKAGSISLVVVPSPTNWSPYVLKALSRGLWLNGENG